MTVPGTAQLVERKRMPFTSLAAAWSIVRYVGISFLTAGALAKNPSRNPLPSLDQKWFWAARPSTGCASERSRVTADSNGAMIVPLEKGNFMSLAATWKSARAAGDSLHFAGATDRREVLRQRPSRGSDPTPPETTIKSSWNYES